MKIEYSGLLIWQTGRSISHKFESEKEMREWFDAMKHNPAVRRITVSSHVITRKPQYNETWENPKL